MRVAKQPPAVRAIAWRIVRGGPAELEYQN